MKEEASWKELIILISDHWSVIIISLVQIRVEYTRKCTCQNLFKIIGNSIESDEIKQIKVNYFKILLRTLLELDGGSENEECEHTRAEQG